MSVDSIGNFLTIIRNGIMASKRSVRAPHSSMRLKIAEILKQEGFIKDYAVLTESSFKEIEIILKYVDGESAIHSIQRISTPGRRVYERSSKISNVVGNLGISIMSTNKGLITNKQAKELAVGGEVICSVW